MQIRKVEEVHYRKSLWDHVSISQSPTILHQENYSYLGTFQINETIQPDFREATKRLKSNVRIERYCVVLWRRASGMKLWKKKYFAALPRVQCPVVKQLTKLSKQMCTFFSSAGLFVLLFSDITVRECRSLLLVLVVLCSSLTCVVCVFSRLRRRDSDEWTLSRKERHAK